MTDLLDYIDATIFSDVAFEGIFTGPSVCEQVQCGAGCPAITIVRPFCLMTDEEIQKTATGMRLLEKSFMEPIGCATAAGLTDEDR
jgi:hypothetical protein